MEILTPQEKVFKMLSSDDNEMVELGKALIPTLTCLSFEDKVKLCCFSCDMSSFISIINSVKKTKSNYTTVYRVVKNCSDVLEPYITSRHRKKSIMSTAVSMARLTVQQFTTKKSKGLFTVQANERNEYIDYCKSRFDHVYGMDHDPIKVMMFVVEKKIPAIQKQKNKKHEEKSRDSRRGYYKSC